MATSDKKGQAGGSNSTRSSPIANMRHRVIDAEQTTVSGFFEKKDPRFVFAAAPHAEYNDNKMKHKE